MVISPSRPGQKAGSRRKIRGHGHVPAGWTWRDGRPRWNAAPGLRKAGWKSGQDLKDERGQWLGRGPSIEAAEAIAAAVTAWRAGEAVPPAFAHLAPAGAAGARPRALNDPRSIGTLLADYLASREFRKLGERTQPEYRSKLKRLVDLLAGWPEPPPIPKLIKLGEGETFDLALRRILDQADAWTDPLRRYAAARLDVLACSIDVLMPPAFGEAGDPLLYTAYWAMRDMDDHHMANGMLAVASAWLEWCRAQRRAIAINPAQLVNREEAPGRIRPATIPELKALVAAAEALGWHSIADSIVLGVDLSWNQADRLKLQWSQISDQHRVRARRRKTGLMMETRLLEGLGQVRIAQIRRRRHNQLAAAAAGDNVAAALTGPVLVCESTGRAWLGDHYRAVFREQVRALAAAGDPARGLQPCPSVADLTDQDLRDTAVTMAYEAGLDEQEIASRTGHSLKRIRDILDKHYGAITRTVGDRGASKLDAWWAGQGGGL